MSAKKSFCRIGDFYCSMSMSVRARSWSNPSRHHSGGVTCVLVTFVHRTKENGSRKTENTPFHRNLGNRQPATFNVLKTSDWTACQNIKAHLWRPKSYLWRAGGLFYLTNDFFFAFCMLYRFEKPLVIFFYVFFFVCVYVRFHFNIFVYCWFIYLIHVL